MKLMFPGLPNRLEYIAEFCLASLVYHSSFLKATLSPQHHLFETPLFQDEELLLNLTTRIRTGDGCAAARIRPTGVPPHVAILSTRLDTVQDILSELEKRAIGAGTATYDGLHDAIRACNEGQLCHYWSGKFRRVPADFTIPDCSVRHVWVLWMCGNNQLRFVMLKIEKDATSKELFPSSLWATVGKLLRKKAKTTSS
ncbi:uncharacterized protein PITG_19680 [Phytophthora infestans T30-4]|uniref:Uncharacterized protein n=1 Tax=Phytophthora infestans (strain T30-4) TaxID=403677 RepID=D0P1D2_PHYIT|nr:uncharacterized protein PITG_19680 [Phytophthora infestans T30-4]EEY54162.1 conserved hypothetical protein [Phytophthora infestans T30-4]|eukprot:XP_002895895.1 conserved hypothetical protein [Phytophthora infestans T30-4]